MPAQRALSAYLRLSAVLLGLKYVCRGQSLLQHASNVLEAPQLHPCLPAALPHAAGRRCTESSPMSGR